MAVIKESHASILRRKNQDEEKHRILNMDFSKASDKANWLAIQSKNHDPYQAKMLRKN